MSRLLLFEKVLDAGPAKVDVVDAYSVAFFVADGAFIELDVNKVQGISLSKSYKIESSINLLPLTC